MQQVRGLIKHSLQTEIHRGSCCSWIILGSLFCQGSGLHSQAGGSICLEESAVLCCLKMMNKESFFCADVSQVVSQGFEGSGAAVTIVLNLVHWAGVTGA